MFSFLPETVTPDTRLIRTTRDLVKRLSIHLRIFSYRRRLVETCFANILRRLMLRIISYYSSPFFAGFPELCRPIPYADAVNGCCLCRRSILLYSLEIDLEKNNTQYS